VSLVLFAAECCTKSLKMCVYMRVSFVLGSCGVGLNIVLFLFPFVKVGNMAVVSFKSCRADYTRMQQIV
jgi:hypothetical protein